MRIIGGAMRVGISKIKIIIAFILMLGIVVPFISSVASAYVMASHTHICHDKEHGTDCVGTKECCKICQSIYGMKNRSANNNNTNRLYKAHVPCLSQSTVSVEFQHISPVPLSSLKVRLNN
jgi:hypothetical protein